MSEPRTEAGKRLLRGRSASGWDTGLHDAVLAIEAEAASAPFDGLTVERLRDAIEWWDREGYKAHDVPNTTNQATDILYLCRPAGGRP